METPEQFINWLEGVLDATNNKLTPGNDRVIRKKITEYHKKCAVTIIPLYDAQQLGSSSNTSALNEEYLTEVEKNKHASTMAELV